MSETGHGREPTGDSYDVVVVGSGLGGLSAAALTARAGLRTLVVERADAVGGYANTFERGGYRFDPAVHWTPQAGAGGLMQAVLEHVGTNDMFEAIELEHLYEAVFPDGVRARAPTDLEALVESHGRLFPADADGIRRYFELVRSVHVEGHQLPMELSLRTLDDAARRFPTFFRLQGATTAEVLDECLSDPRAKAVCAASWPFAGAVPSRGSFVAQAQLLMNAMEGTYLARGGFGTLVQALAAGVTRNGGEIVASNGAARIHVRDGRAHGVSLKGGQSVRATTVISNADAIQTFDELIGTEHVPRGYARKLARMTVSPSAFVLLCATGMDISGAELAHETLVFDDWDHEAATERMAAGRPAGVWVSVPTLVDPSLAPPGEHVVIATSLASYDISRPWEEHAEEFRERLLDVVETVLPGLRSSLLHSEHATPRSIERLGANHRGAIYGWESTPRQTGTRRLTHQTPIDGLLLSGHWSLPGSNVIRVFASGVHTAQLALREQGHGEALPTFAGANLPSVDDAA